MKYRDVNSPTVFHDDSKVCYFDLYLKAKDKKGKAEFRRTFIDAAHFTGVFVEDEYPIIEGNITFKIPASLEGILLVDENFPDHGISRSEQTTADGSRIISYTITDLPKRPEDIASPPALASRPHISVRGYFADTDELYKYHYDLLKTDTTLASTPDIQQSSLLDDCEYIRICSEKYSLCGIRRRRGRLPSGHPGRDLAQALR